MKTNHLHDPEKWKEPRAIFVNSMSDLHLGDWPVEYIDQIYDVMLAVPRHIYMILTKRPKRMRDYLVGTGATIGEAEAVTGDGAFTYCRHGIPEFKVCATCGVDGLRVDGYLHRRGLTEVPEHIWIGSTIESDLFTFRADVLRQIPAVNRMISAEPLLGPLPSLDLEGISWVIVGGESGPGFRTMDLDWARGVRDQCLAEGVAFFYKQGSGIRTEMHQELDGERWEQRPDAKGSSQRSQAGQPTLPMERR
jgi:protein gp37